MVCLLDWCFLFTLREKDGEDGGLGDFGFQGIFS